MNEKKAIIKGWCNTEHNFRNQPDGFGKPCLICRECGFATTDQDTIRRWENDIKKDIMGSQHLPGVKLDSDKIDVTLLQEFSRALHEVSRVGDYGQNKYTRSGFLTVANGVRRYTRAMLDHWFKEDTEGTYDQDPWYDTEMGLHWKGMIRHDAQVAWNALARLELKLREEER
jgi:hypothetical protein